MFKLLMLLVIAAVTYLFIKSYGRRDDVRQKETSAEDMVCCRHCSVHLPRSESIKAGEDFYCCQEHRNAVKK